MFHALRYPVRHFVRDSVMPMFIGPDEAGILVEALEVRIMARRSLEEIKARAEKFADEFESYDPEPGHADAPLPPVIAIKLAAWRRDTAEQELADAVRAARAAAVVARGRRGDRHQR